MAKPWIVAVDGPAGSGKSSICSRVATILNWTYVNTGAIYRAVGFLMRQNDVATDDKSMDQFLDEVTPHISWDPEKKRLYYKDQDLTNDLYSPDATSGASIVAKMPKVREKLLAVQRDMTLKSPIGALVDGRDIGTVIFPDADLKIFMTASIEERAKRRLQQFSKSDTGSDIPSLDKVKSEIEERDERDSGRGTAPLKQADDALLFDNSGMSIDEAVNQLVKIIRDKLER